MVRCFLVVVIFLPSRETPVEMGKIWDKHDDILLVLTVIALWLQTRRRAKCVYIAGGLHIGVGYYILQICRLIRSQVFGFACKCAIFGKVSHVITRFSIRFISAY